MPDKYGQYFSVYVLSVWTILSFSFTLSPALISISFMLLCLPGLLHFKLSNFTRYEKILFLLFAVFYLSILLSGLYSEDKDEALRKLILKLPILCFPLLISALRYIDHKTKIYMTVILLFAMYLPAAVSVYNYFINRELFDQLILESKPLPVEFGYGIYHIQFSVLLAASVLCGFWLLLKQKTYQLSGSLYALTLILTILNTVFIHILSARTGLLALYAGMSILLLQAASSIPRKYKLYFFMSMIAVPLLLFLFSSSLRNRLSNSISDLQVVWSGKDANDYSFAMRVEAWKNAAELISHHPFTGVGTGDADKELNKNFATFNPNIQENNRKNPHMQVLETAAQSGIVSAMIYMSIFCLIWFGRIPLKSPASAMAMLLFIASCFESILERQATVVGFSVLIAFALCLYTEPNTTKKSEP